MATRWGRELWVLCVWGEKVCHKSNCKVQLNKEIFFFPKTRMNAMYSIYLWEWISRFYFVSKYICLSSYKNFKTKIMLIKNVKYFDTNPIYTMSLSPVQKWLMYSYNQTGNWNLRFHSQIFFEKENINIFF